jgi:serine/threonine-protein kinase
MSTLADRLQVLVGHGYRIERELPLGGMSRLYVARDLAVEREVVVKVLPPDLACTASTGRFQREVEVTAQLLHPNIVPVLGAGGDDALRFYVTPFVAGESLRELLAREGALPLDAVLRVLDDVLDALAYAHSRGVVHRDVKPGNILLAAGGRAMLADFGIASALSPDDDTRSDVVPGTPMYMAPEHPRDARADLWATCVVAHEMLTGARPAPGVTAGVKAGVKAGAVVRARARALGPGEARRAEALAAVVARGLSAEPARRQPSAEALRAAIATARQRRVSRRTLVAFAGILVVALAGFAASQPTMLAALARERGREAGARFALDTAIVAYREALGHRADDAVAQLGLARSLAWRAQEGDLNEAARLLHGVGSDVPGADAVPALRALAERRYPEACSAFAAAARRDSLDAQAWMGLAECRRRDNTVVADTASPSGYAFRTSFHGAALAYERVLDRAATATFVYERLARARLSATNVQRVGYLAAEEGARRVLMAYPEITGDSVGYVPRPPMLFHVPPSRTAAVELNLTKLRERYRDWTRADPRNFAAHQALSEALEKLGYLENTGPDDLAALDEIRQARGLADSASQLRLLHVEVRQRLKANEWTGARRLADSALARWRTPSAEEAVHLAGLAAITGRRTRLTVLLHTLAGTNSQQVRSHTGDLLALPPAIIRARADVQVAALFGDCEALRGAAARVTRGLRAVTTDERAREVAEAALLEKPYALARACGERLTGGRADSSADALVRLESALASGGAPRLRATMAQLQRMRAHDRPGDLAMDYALGEAQLLLAIADTAAALKALDVALDGLAMQGGYVLTDPMQAAALVRAMALCARLAAAHGDQPTARRWSEAVATLWTGAEAPLDAVVADMRRLAAASAAPAASVASSAPRGTGAP